MRRLFVIVLLVLLPLRGWAASAMALEMLPASPVSAAHALCPDHAMAASDGAHGEHGAGQDATGGDTTTHDASHPHCTACQLPALGWPVWPSLVMAPPPGTPAVHATVRRNPAPRRLIKPPIT